MAKIAIGYLKIYEMRGATTPRAPLGCFLSLAGAKYNWITTF